MKSYVIVAAVALTLAACQRPADETSPEVVDNATDATPSEAQPDRTTPPAPPKAAAPPRRAPADVAAEKAAADAGAATPAAGDGPSEVTRDNAKQAAEETNLHPRTP